MELPIQLRSTPDGFFPEPAIAALGQAHARAHLPWQHQLLEAVMANDSRQLDILLQLPEAEALYDEGFDLPLITLALIHGSTACWRVWREHGYGMDRVVCSGGGPVTLAQLACETCDPTQLSRLLDAKILDTASCLDHGLHSGSREKFLFWAQQWQDKGLPFDVRMQQLCHAGAAAGAHSETEWRANELGRRWVARMGILRSWRVRRLWFTWLAQPPPTPADRPLWRVPLLRAMQPHLGQNQVQLAMDTHHQRHWAAVLIASGVARVERDGLRRFAVCLGNGMSLADASHDLLWLQMQQALIQENSPLLGILPDALRGRQRPSMIASRLGATQAEASRQMLLLELDTARVGSGKAARWRL